jgi:hypothetical protein
MLCVPRQSDRQCQGKRADKKATVKDVDGGFERHIHAEIEGSNRFHLNSFHLKVVKKALTPSA